MLYNLTENKIKKYNTMSYKNENDIIETIRKKSKGEPDWLVGISNNLISEKLAADKTNNIDAIEKANSRLESFNIDLDGFNEMTTERKQKPHIVEFTKERYKPVNNLNNNYNSFTDETPETTVEGKNDNVTMRKGEDIYSNRKEKNDFSDFYDKSNSYKVENFGLFKSPVEDIKETSRLFWKLGAEFYLRKKLDCQTSAWMLEHSLQDNPEDIWRGNDSRVAYMINNSPEYLSAVDNAIAQSRNGVLENKDIYVKFEKNKDLEYSIHRATIILNGSKGDDGKWRIHAVLDEDYDYTELMHIFKTNENFKKEFDVGAAANDVAFFSSYLGAIKPYHVTVDFYTTR